MTAKLSIDEEMAIIDKVCGNCRHYDDKDDSYCIKCHKVETAVKKRQLPTHRQLCLLAARLIEQNVYHPKAYPFRFIIEPGFRSELPDVFAFTRYASYLVECKASRSDFLADRKKAFRKKPEEGIGEIRILLCNKGIAKESEIPQGWLFLEALDENTVKVPRNFCIRFMQYNNTDKKKLKKFCIRNATAETEFMWSWEYRNKHKCLISVPKDKVIIKEDEN